MAPSFSDSFWSSDYAGGLGVLFGKLNQGIAENLQVLTIARMRAAAEEAYGAKLAEITPATDRINGGFQRDEGASLRKVRSSGKYSEDAADQNLGIRRSPY